MNLMIIGHGGHGKDELAKAMGLKYESSSQAANRLFIYDSLKGDFGYNSPEQCYNDRRSKRELWHDLICKFNADDPARLAKEMLKTSDHYCGIRSKRELEAIKAERLYDLYIWVDASERLPLEDYKSMKLTPNDADIIVTNNGSLKDFHRKAINLKKALGL